MRQATGSIIIEASVEKVWAVLADLGAADKCFPGVTKSYYLSEQKAGVGAARHCDVRSGAMKGSVQERITEWREGEGFSLELYDSTGVPYRRMEADFEIEACAQGTRLTQTIRFAMKGGPLAPVLALVGSMMMKKEMPKMLEGVKACVDGAVG